MLRLGSGRTAGLRWGAIGALFRVSISCRPFGVALAAGVLAWPGLTYAGGPMSAPVGFGDDVCWENTTDLGVPCSSDADCAVGVCGVKNRYLSFTPPGGASLAIRVKLLDVPQFPQFNGEVRWVGPASAYPHTLDPADGTFTASRLECDPYFQDWGGVGLLNAYGSEIVPSSTIALAAPLYEVRTATAKCVSMGIESCLSDPLIIATGKWGDVVSAFGSGAQPNNTDLAAVFGTFEPDDALRQPKAQAQLTPNAPDPNNPVTMLDLTASLRGFQGFAYPYAGPETCPHREPACGDGVLDPDEDCDDGDVVPGDGCDALCHSETATAVFSLVPVPPPAPKADPYPPGVVVAGSSIHVPPGLRVWFDLFVSDWDPDGDGLPLLFDAQAQVDPAGYTSGLAGSVTPAVDGVDEALFMDLDRQLEWFNSGLVAADNSSEARRVGVSVLFSGAADPGVDAYLATLVMDVSPDAAGAFTVGFDPDHAATFLRDGELDNLGNPIPIAELRPAIVTILGACCGSDGTCTVEGQTGCPVGTTPVAACFGDCNGNGLDDGCDAVADCNGNQVPDTCDVLNKASEDCDGNGVPDECQPDCNNNGIADRCDIDGGASPDCTGNGIPDECEPDCNTNMTADSCNIAGGTSPDCNINGIPDECDLAAGASADLHATGVPDECEAKSRYLSVSPPGPVTAGVSDYALRIKLIDSDTFPGAVGEIRWAGTPFPFFDTPADLIAISPLQCDPHFENWLVVDPVHIIGPAVVPSSTYEIRSATQDCIDTGDESCMSVPIIRTTGQWGDVVAAFGGSSQPNFADIGAEVDRFRGFDRVSMTRTDLVPESPDQVINFSDISAGVDAFRGFLYPFAGPGTCAP